MAGEHDQMRKKNEELANAYKEKTRRLLQVQELYDKAKRKAEMGSLERAANDAVDMNLHNGYAGIEASNADFYNQMKEANYPFRDFSSARGDSSGMNTGVQRSRISSRVDPTRWSTGAAGSLRGSICFKNRGLN